MTLLVSDVCTASPLSDRIVQSDKNDETTLLQQNVSFTQVPAFIAKTSRMNSLSIELRIVRFWANDPLTISFTRPIFSSRSSNNCAILVGSNNTFSIEAYNDIIKISSSRTLAAENLTVKCSNNFVENNEIGTIYANVHTRSKSVNQTAVEAFRVIPNQIYAFESFNFFGSYVSSKNGGGIKFKFVPLLALNRNDLINLTAVNRSIFNASNEIHHRCLLINSKTGLPIGLKKVSVSRSGQSLSIILNNSVLSMGSYEFQCNSSNLLKENAKAGTVGIFIKTSRDTIKSNILNYTIQPNEVIVNSIKQSNDGDRYAFGRTGTLLFKFTPRTTLVGGDQDFHRM